MLFQLLSPGPGKGVSVVLRPRGPHGGTFALVEHAELNGASVGYAATHAAKGINFSQDLPFCDAPHGWVAAHGSNGAEVHADEKYGFSERGGRVGRFVSGVSGSDYNDVIFLQHGVCSTWNMVFRSGSFGSATGLPAPA